MGFVQLPIIQILGTEFIIYDAHLCSMKIDFDKFKALQYCDNELCEYFSKIGLGNVCTLSSKNNQAYCNGYNTRWEITKDTFFMTFVVINL